MDKKLLAEFKDAVCSSCADFAGCLHFEASCWTVSDWKSLADELKRMSHNMHSLSRSLASYSDSARRMAEKEDENVCK